MKVVSQETWKQLFSLPYQTSHQETINLKLNEYIGDPISVADNWARGWVGKFEKITKAGIPNPPRVPSPDKLSPGWNCFRGRKWQPSTPPDGTIVFDTETHGAYKQFPILGVAVNTRNWYIWVSDWAKGSTFSGSLIELNPDSLVIAHNASFDAARCANQYRDDSPEWLDTQSLVQATNGITKKLLNTFKGKKKKPAWFYSGCGVSLLDAVTYHVTDGSAKITQEDKELRNFFVNCGISDEDRQALIANWHKLVGYAINDVHCTYHLFRVVLPQYMQVCPHLTSLMAQSLMLRAKFPVNPDFADWVNYCDIQFQMRDKQVRQIIDGLVQNTQYQPGDPWLDKLDWSATSRGKYAGIPEWKKANNGISLRSRSLPYLLKLRWNGKPIQYEVGLGWHYLSDEGEPVKLPHKDGDDLNVGNPLADVYKPYIESGILDSALPDFDLRSFHTLYFETTYWLGNRDRIKEIYVSQNHVHVPSIIPRRTVTQRSGDKLWLTVPDWKEGKIGTSIKSQIRLPDDSPYWLIGADFSTQELNIAALLSDWITNQELGSNDFSLSVFDGSKETKTDLHSKLAASFQISRAAAKSMNFAGLYNCGANRYATILKQEAKDIANPGELAQQILESKRGEKLPALEPEWIVFAALLKAGYLNLAIRVGNRFKYLPRLALGGTDSWYYNSIEARLNQSVPRTPLLDCRMPRWLERANSSGSEFMTRANWNIQATGVDILSLFLVLMDYLRAKKGLSFTYVVSRHDEIWYKAHESEIEQVAECMQLAHISCWAALANKLGIFALPKSLCLFPEINVDKVLRKEVSLDVFDGYGIPPREGYYIKSDAFLAD